MNEYGIHDRVIVTQRNRNRITSFKTTMLNTGSWYKSVGNTEIREFLSELARVPSRSIPKKSPIGPVSVKEENTEY